MLLARGVPVRAFVHKLDERSDRLRALGAEIVEGDFLDAASVKRAVDGVSAIYFAYPVKDGLLDATAIMALAAREAGVARLVNLVMLRSSLDAPTPRMRQNHLSEQVFEWAGIGVVHLRATVFYENLRALVRSNLSANGPILLPWGDESTVIPLVSAKDVASVGVGLLTKPSLPSPSSYPVIGAVLTLSDIIATFATKKSPTRSGAGRLLPVAATRMPWSTCPNCGDSSAPPASVRRISNSRLPIRSRALAGPSPRRSRLSCARSKSPWRRQ
jgi:uncharacterized protein YbjT (DUF2867 family)